MGLCTSCDLPADYYDHCPSDPYLSNSKLLPPEGRDECNAQRNAEIYYYPTNYPTNYTEIKHQIPEEYQQNYSQDSYQNYPNYIRPPAYNPYQ